MIRNKLTVIMPFLNEGEEVENTISSIRETVKKRVDILIINDNSTDSIDYKLIACKYDAVYVKNKKRIGVAASRDKGIALINTPYFLLLDAHMRFYQSDWDEIIINELEKDDRVLLCCNTKVLYKDNTGKIDDSHRTSAFGARINLEEGQLMLDAEWNLMEKKTKDTTEAIGCILGAGYAASKRYWQYLRGLEGLIYYGSDESYISLKVWLEGGQCCLLKNIIIGHIYRKEAPYKIESKDSIFNKLWIAEVLLPMPYKLRIFGALYMKNPRVFEQAYHMIKKKRKPIKSLQQYYRQILTVDFNNFVAINKRRKIETEEQLQVKQEKLNHIFKHLLLNCNTLPSSGLWYGRMGCLLFLVQYDHIKNQDLYEELINELIDEIYSRIENSSLNIDFGDGLCGIAYGLAWLIDHKLMEGDLNEVLQDVDQRIMERDPLRITDYSLKSGLAGILYYILYRLQIAKKLHLSTPFDADYLNRLYKASLKVMKTPEKLACFEMASWFIAFRHDPELELEIPDITQLLNLNTLKTMEMDVSKISLKNGLAGLGLSRLNI